MLGLEVTLLGAWAWISETTNITAKPAIMVRNMAKTFQELMKIRNRLTYVDKTIEPTVLGQKY